jgi:hypothetical protein
MTKAVISAVEAMTEKASQPLIKGGVPLFKWRPNASVEDFLEEDVESADEYENFTEDNFDPTEPDNDVVEEPDNYDDIEPLNDDDVNVLDDNEVNDPAVFEPDPDDFGPDELDPDADEGAEANDDPGDEDPGGDAPNTNVEPDANEDSGTNRYNLRSDRGRSYGHQLDHQMDDPVSSKSYESGVQVLQQAADKMDESLDGIYKYIFGHIMTQMTATAGIKKHGQSAVDALRQEFCQLLDSKNVFEPLDASTLTASQKRESLCAVNLIKEKRSGKLKGRTCADGRSQRSKYKKEDTTSPTVSTDALMISLMIDAKERRDVATAVVEGAYLHADMEDFVLLKLVGEAVDIMCQVNPKYEKFVVIENGKKVLYLQLLKALYGCVQSALLWYNLLTNTLVRMGFKLNPYDLCVANSQIKGKQCTVAWYVDDNKILHVDDTVVTDIIEKIEAKFGKMTVTRGKHHVVLGMDITLTTTTAPSRF